MKFYKAILLSVFLLVLGAGFASPIESENFINQCGIDVEHSVYVDIETVDAFSFISVESLFIIPNSIYGIPSYLDRNFTATSKIAAKSRGSPRLINENLPITKNTKGDYNVDKTLPDKRKFGLLINHQ